MKHDEKYEEIDRKAQERRDKAGLDRRFAELQGRAELIALNNARNGRGPTTPEAMLPAVVKERGDAECAAALDLGYLVAEVVASSIATKTLEAWETKKQEEINEILKSKLIPAKAEVEKLRTAEGNCAARLAEAKALLRLCEPGSTDYPGCLDAVAREERVGEDLKERRLEAGKVLTAAQDEIARHSKSLEVFSAILALRKARESQRDLAAEINAFEQKVASAKNAIEAQYEAVKQAFGYTVNGLVLQKL